MVHMMYEASDDDRGTVQALARELDQTHVDGKQFSQTRLEVAMLIYNMYS